MRGLKLLTEEVGAFIDQNYIVSGHGVVVDLVQ